MKRFRIIASTVVAAVTAILLTACDDNNENIGSSLVQTDSNVVIASDFKLEGKTCQNSRIQSRTITQLIGSIDAADYGCLTADFVTQFMPSAKLDTLLKSREQLDSIKLLMMFNKGSFVGDSVVPMGVEVYRLNKQLNAPIFSDFNPVEYYDASAPIGEKVYSASNLSYWGDNTDTYNAIYVNLPKQMGLNLFDLYTTNPSAVLSPTSFAQYFPGIYVKNCYGSGRVTKIGATAVELFFHYNTVNSAGNDTILSTSTILLQATPEIITNNNISYRTSDNISQRISQGQQLVVAPAGYDVEIKFPIEDIIRYYKEHKGMLSVVNSLTMSIPVEKISNTYGIEPPKYLLMVKKSERQKFFENSEITDNVNSFYAEYSTSNNAYNFSSFRQYLLDAIAKIDKGETLNPDDYTFLLTPVNIETETVSGYYQNTTVVKTIAPYIDGPAMARLLIDDAEIQFTFSNQSSK